MTTLYWSAAIVGGFLSGSVMYSEILPKIFAHKDICRLSGDRNPGAFNVFSQCGVGLGMVCLLFDLAKGLVPVLLAALFLSVDSPFFAGVMVAPVCGHAVGIVLKWREDYNEQSVGKNRCQDITINGDYTLNWTDVTSPDGGAYFRALILEVK